jgi:hypothetical protein
MDYLLGLFSSSTIFQVRARWITLLVSKPPIICMVVLDFYTLGSSKDFKSTFDFHNQVGNLEQWSKNTMAQMYLLLVNIPFSWATKPGVLDSSWSTETQSPRGPLTTIVFILLGA